MRLYQDAHGVIKDKVTGASLNSTACSFAPTDPDERDDHLVVYRRSRSPRANPKDIDTNDTLAMLAIIIASKIFRPS